MVVNVETEVTSGSLVTSLVVSFTSLRLKMLSKLPKPALTKFYSDTVLVGIYQTSLT